MSLILARPPPCRRELFWIRIPKSHNVLEQLAGMAAKGKLRPKIAAQVGPAKSNAKATSRRTACTRLALIVFDSARCRFSRRLPPFTAAEHPHTAAEHPHTAAMLTYAGAGAVHGRRGAQRVGLP
eukprot:1619807-Rhodomonas_salina.1